MDNETFANDNQFAEAQIKVIGVGGAGGNAVNRMITEKVQGVDSVPALTTAGWSMPLRPSPAWWAQSWK